MGPPKNKWTSEEEAALRKGVNKHGAGKWRKIINDPEFSTALVHRTNVSIKDKWRIMNGARVDCKLDDLTHDVKLASSYTLKQVKHEMKYVSAASDKVKATVDAEVLRLRHMSPEDAVAAAAEAVKMAEAATAEAEEAEKEAVEAERLAEEKKAIADELKRKLMEKKARAAAKHKKRGHSKC